MGKRLLASFLAAAMMLTMAPFAFAIENTEDTIDADQIPATEEAVDEENQIETKDTSTLQSDIDAATGTYTLAADTTADITISKDLVLDLSGKTLTNTSVGKATISVTNGATVTVKNGTVIGGTSYYNIEVAVGATLTLENVTATAGNVGASMIDNFGTLTVESGTYTGGLNVIKNEPNATLIINNGKFELLQGYPKGIVGTIFNYGSLTIHDGEFLQSDTKTGSVYGYPQVVYTDKDKETNSTPSTTIVGGTFKNSHTNQRAWTIRSTNAATPTTTVTGGKFNKKVTSSYLKNGYASTTTKVNGYYGLATAITQVTLNKTKVNLRGGESFKVQVTDVEPTSAEVKTYSMRGSGNTANFDSKTGVVTARKVGDYKVIVTPAGAGATESECVFHITEGNATVTTKNKNVIHYLTLKDAFANALSGETVTLLTDMTEDVTLNPSAKKSYILNLNGHTLTNASGDTITVGAKANLTIQGEGTVDNVTHAKAAIYNNGTVTLNGGTYTRSLETGETVTTKNTYYNILNHGIMTINNGVTVKQDGNYSSLVANGYYNYNEKDAGERTAYIDGIGQANPKLTINGGNFSGGINTIKNDDGAELTIQDGTFRNATQYVVMNNNIAAINGGKFEGLNNNMKVVYTQYYDGGVNAGKLSITGGNFVGKITGNESANIKISNGVFSVQPDAKYLAPGYKTELTNGVYVVKAGTNDAMTKVNEAIADSTNEKIEEAIKAVTEIPNETLASSSTTMDKLNELGSKLTTGNDAKVEVKAEGKIQSVDAAAALSKDMAADDNAKQIITVTATEQSGDTNTTANAAITAVKGSTTDTRTQVLDIKMTRQIGDNAAQEVKPNVPVPVTIKMPDGWKNAQIVYVNGGETELVKTTVSNGSISATFNHFSTYVLVETEASKNPNEYEIILTPNTTDVSAGDTLTYTVSLKHTVGDGTEGMFTFVPDTTSGLLSDGKFTPETGLTNYQFGKDNGKDKLVLKELDLQEGETKIIGTLSYTVQAYPDDNTKIEYTGTSEGTVSNEGRQVEATVRLINDKDVTYHVVKVTFSAADGTMTEGYVKYGESSPLYATLDALKIQDDTKKVTVPALSTAKVNGTGGADYRVLDDKWHLSTDDTQVYPLASGIKTSVTFVENYVKLAKVTIPQDNNKNLVQITKEVTRTVGDDSYVDQSTDLEFKLTNDAIPKPGMKYEVKVKVGEEEITPTGPDNGIYTVDGGKITGDVSFELKQKMALTADDIGIFTDTDTAGNKTYRDYSTYSGKRTLVLIKGDADAKYQFTTTTEQHPTIYKTDAYDGYNFGVLIDPTNVEENKNDMLTYLVDTLKLNVVTNEDEVNPTIKYDFNTNGLNGAPLADAQVTRDFIRKAADSGWYWEPTDDLLLKADVITAGDGADLYDKDTYKGTADGHVYADDLSTFMYLYVGMPKTN